ncbi:MAG: sulfatase-like hydrolase/transferase, partial [Chitinophagaceae bacterium]|nr:sulfatase-like hydrolase/transferase [Chitinophagaceae bacterium]
YEQQDFHSRQIDVWGISDKNLFLEANRILSQQSKPFFAIIQTADNHRPYTIPQEDLGEFKKVDFPQDTLNKYGFHSNAELNGFRYTDFCYRKFFEASKTQPYFQNTLFIFVGDHGNKGDPGNLLPKAWTQEALNREHVPLLFFSPRLLRPAVRSNVCSQLDILPSIAGLLSVSYTYSGMGRNLFESNADTNDFKYSSAFIIDHDENKIGMLNSRYYFRKILNSNTKSLVSIINNEPVPKGKLADSLQNVLNNFTEAFYQTALYLLYNNKRDNH